MPILNVNHVSKIYGTKVLPEPDGPIMATNSPLSTEKLISCSALNFCFVP
jgi:hypothetical protein